MLHEGGTRIDEYLYVIFNLAQKIGIIQICSLCLNEFRKNLTANPERSPLMHSYSYALAGDRPDLFARFPLNFVSFMQHAA